MKKLFVFNFLTSTTKIMKTHYWYRSRFEENFSKFFRNSRGKFFGQNFFFTFSTFQVKIHTLTKKNRKKNSSFLTSDEIDVRLKLTFDISNWWRNLPCQFRLSFSKIDSRLLCQKELAKSPVYNNSPGTRILLEAIGGCCYQPL